MTIGFRKVSSGKTVSCNAGELRIAGSSLQLLVVGSTQGAPPPTKPPPPEPTVLDASPEGEPLLPCTNATTAVLSLLAPP